MLKLLSLVSLLFVYSNAAEGSQATTFMASVTDSYTLVADFSLAKLEFRHLQILNADGHPIECSEGDAVDGPVIFRVPDKFTSLTLDQFFPRGKLYCRSTHNAGPHILYVNIWGLK